MVFSLSLFASIKACSNKAFASALSSLINLRGDGQTRGSAEEGSNKAEHATCLCFRATVYGILLHHKHDRITEKFNFSFCVY